jgi:predicted O-linked N-acetylglucosamine transferase (SPINDLY family)
MVLAEWGPDVQSVNAALVEVVKTLGAKRKQAEAAVAAVAGEVNSPGADEAREKLKSVAEMMNKLLAKMSSRKEFSIPATVYFADMCLAAGLPDVARDAYLRVANRAEKDPAYAKSAGKALQRVRAQLVDLLVKTGDYEEAYKQISQLAAANPRALDLLMTQGRILQSWSQRDASRYAEAVAHWARLRNMLLGAVKKPPEYFEITYNLAAALYGQAAEAKDKAQAAEKAKEAEKLLKSTLVLSPNLSGPEMVEQYNALLKKVSALYQRAGSR